MALLSTVAVQAQKGNNQFNVLAEVGIPPKDYNPGVGGYLQFLYGIGQSGQVGLTTGIMKFSEKKAPIGADREPTKLYTIPVLVGYRQHLKSFYLEPQVGYGALNGKIDIGGDWSRPSVGAFYWAMGAGLDFKKLTIGVRYQSAHGAENSDAGTWHDKAFHFVGVQMGYVLFRK